MTGEQRRAADRGEASRRISRSKRDEPERSTDRTGEASGQPDTTSKTGHQLDTIRGQPEETSARSNEGGDEPNMISKRPDTTPGQADTTGHQLDTIGGQLEQTKARSDEGGDEPNMISKRPDTTPGQADTTGHPLDTIGGQLGQTNARSDEGGDEPNMISKRPDTNAVQPDTASHQLDTIGGQLGQTSERSDDTSDQPDPIKERQDTIGGQSETIGDQPEKTTDRLESTSGQASDLDIERREPAHSSVLLDEVVEFLQPRAGTGFRALDATVGAGGHSFGLLEHSAPEGSLIGLDADPAALELARARLAPFAGRYTLYQRNFADLGALGLPQVDAIVFDLGLSSMQLEASGRGFSFRADEPLDMRFDPSGSGLTAAELLNTASEAELERILREHGEEPRARRVMRSIVQHRPLERTGDLVAAVTAALGPTRGRIHPATRTFQALRIAVNDELIALEAGLDAGLELLAPGGRIAVISFHSLEDRIVKWRFRGWADRGLVRVLTKRPVQPGDAEVQRNPRARSAKLRVAERLAR